MTFQDPIRSEARTTEPGPAVSWAAVIAGAFAAAALSLVLLAIGMAFGLSMVSPWETGPAGEDTAVAVGIGAVIFLLIVHGASSGVGGYIAGRLRARWTNLRLDETQFRDTAHGMLVWALSAVVGALMVACFSAKVVGGGLALGAAGVSAAGDLAGGAMAQSGSRSPDGRRNLEGYFVDTLFRPAASTAQQAGATTGTTTPRRK